MYAARAAEISLVVREMRERKDLIAVSGWEQDKQRERRLER